MPRAATSSRRSSRAATSRARPSTCTSGPGQQQPDHDAALRRGRARQRGGRLLRLRAGRALHNRRQRHEARQLRLRGQAGNRARKRHAGEPGGSRLSLPQRHPASSKEHHCALRPADQGRPRARPGPGPRRRLDIGVTDGRIAAIEPNIDAAEAKRVIEVKGDNRYVTPGLIDIHTHVAYGATTPGVGMGCCDPDQVGVCSGVTTVLDCGSVGVANIGVLQAHVIPRAKTRDHPLRQRRQLRPHDAGLAPTSTRMDDVDAKAIAGCIEANPGLIKGFKLRLVGPVAQNQSEELVKLVQGDLARASPAADGAHRRHAGGGLRQGVRARRAICSRTSTPATS